MKSGFLCIVLLTCVVFFPSLHHVPRADQVTYLAEVAFKKDFQSLAIQTFDLARTRELAPGDLFLFRPFLYFFLGTEKFLFGYNWVAWQLTGIVLHLIVLGLFLKLLINIRRSVFALALTAVLAVAAIPMEMVIWQHINAYLIFIAAILIALDQMFSYVHRGRTQSWRLAVIGLSLMVACFTYEIANLYALLFCFYFLTYDTGKRRVLRAAVMVVPPVFYALCSVWNWQYLTGIHMFEAHPQTGAVQAVHAGVGTVLANMAYVNFFWLFTGIFPQQFDLILDSRAALTLSKSAPPFLNVLSLAMLLLFCWIVTRKGKERSAFRPWSFLMFAMVLVFDAAIVFGRVNSAGTGALSNSLYYAYIFWVFFLLGVYSFIDFDELRKFAQLRVVKLGAGVLLIFFIGMNAQRVYMANAQRAALSDDTWKLVHQIEALKKAHKDDVKFTFFVPTSYPGNYVVSRARREIPGSREYSYIEALYLDVFTGDHPTVTIQ